MGEGIMMIWRIFFRMRAGVEEWRDEGESRESRKFAHPYQGKR
jgi:hypothetical protein